MHFFPDSVITSLSRLVHGSGVNWLPWPVLRMPGTRPVRRSAFSSAARLSPLSIWLESSQPGTWRLLPVHHRAQIRVLPCRFPNAGNVRAPHLIGAADDQVPRQNTGLSGSLIRNAGARTAPRGFVPHLPAQPLEPLAG